MSLRLLMMIVLLAGTLPAQVAQKANERYRTPEARRGMLDVLAAPDRAERVGADAIVRALRIRPGSTVADLGTGGGAMLPVLSRAVGPQGRVFAEDIFPDFLSHAKANNGKLANVTWVLGSEKDVQLPAASLDLALTIDAYHHYDYPAEVVASIRKALKPGGRFAIVEYFKRPGVMDPVADAVQHIRLDRDDLIKEVTGFGFRLERTVEHVPGKQYIAVFTPVR